MFSLIMSNFHLQRCMTSFKYSNIKYSLNIIQPGIEIFHMEVFHWTRKNHSINHRDLDLEIFKWWTNNTSLNRLYIGQQKGSLIMINLKKHIVFILYIYFSKNDIKIAGFCDKKCILWYCIKSNACKQMRWFFNRQSSDKRYFTMCLFSKGFHFL